MPLQFDLQSSMDRLKARDYEQQRSVVSDLQSSMDRLKDHTSRLFVATEVIYNPVWID